MAFNAVPTVATGDSWSAANHNTYLKDNLADHEARILLTAANLKIAKRQGGSPTVWQTQGDTNYTPSTAPTIYIGVIRMIFANQATRTVIATFPAAFTELPIVIVGAPNWVSGAMDLYRKHTAVLVNQVSIEIGFGSAKTITIDVPWMAIGV